MNDSEKKLLHSSLTKNYIFMHIARTNAHKHLSIPSSQKMPNFKKVENFEKSENFEILMRFLRAIFRLTSKTLCLSKDH